MITPKLVVKIGNQYTYKIEAKSGSTKNPWNLNWEPTYIYQKNG